MRQYKVPKEFEHYRLDQFIAKKLPAASRNRIQKLIAGGFARLNGRVCAKAARKVLHEDTVEVDIPAPKRTEVLPEKIELDVIYEDKDLIVINKPAGMVVHPAQGHRSGTLVNALLAHCKDLSGIGGVERPGIVHRLDKETSGLIVIAKNDNAHGVLSNAFKNRTVEKRYLAMVHGVVKEDKGTLSAPIGRSQSDRKKMAVIELKTEKEKSDNEKKHRRSKSRAAVTHFSVLKRYKDKTLLDLKLETGRTHQIRVHLSHAGYPIVGDTIYGLKKDRSERMMLHSFFLGFQHPVRDNQVRLEKKPDWKSS
ncbi:MAG: RluA family pseudouridine synthase [Candidatus Margulisiibacteriota bacterium]